jgi:hypothetical protein
MTLVAITIVLLAITVLCYITGTIWLSQYAARLGAGPRMMTLLLPPYAFYFAFYKLDQDTKHKPVFLWSFGIIATIVLLIIFGQPLSLAARGDWSALQPPVEEVKTVEAYKAEPAKPADTTAPVAPAVPTDSVDAQPDSAAPADGAAPAAPADGAAPAAPADGAAPAAPADGAAPAAPADGAAAPK